MDDLLAAARRWGVAPEYYDGLRNHHTAGPETLKRLIAAISKGGAQANPPPPHSLPQQRAYQGDDRRHWGIAVQLYALRSRRNWGHGDFTDLARLIALAAARGASAVGLNPLHALFPDRAEDASPYAPNSRLFLNLLYIDVDAIQEFPGVQAAGLNNEIAALRESELIAYEQVARVKLKALHLAHQNFRAAASTERRSDFESYRQTHGDALVRFACFEVLRGQLAPTPWPQWPNNWRRPDNAWLKSFRQDHEVGCEFHEFVQWIADRQLGACQAAARRLGMSIGLYTDLAVGIDRHGADAWSWQDVVLSDVSIGAPPDEFNPGGQDWGLAPFNPHTLPAGDFAVMRELLQATMRHAGAIRIDHVFGLQRLFLFPYDMRAADGTYVRFPFEDLLSVITEESNRFRCIVVGEDLGTVPDNFRETLERWGIWGCRVILFERDSDGRFRPPQTYPAEALASFNTHDMASYRGWRESYDLGVKRALGLDPGETDESRGHVQAALRDALDRWASGYSPDDVAAVAAFLGATPTRLVVIALDDILDVREQINVPGTRDQHPNWRRKLPMALEDLGTHAGLEGVAHAFKSAGRGL
jgi:4-alpha-glucanotransferase